MKHNFVSLVLSIAVLVVMMWCTTLFEVGTWQRMVFAPLSLLPVFLIFYFLLESVFATTNFKGIVEKAWRGQDFTYKY